jgi:transcriptional regulator with XRE-family HTH domain
MSDIIPVDVKTSPEARGKRLKSLRKMADLSRKALTIKHQISASTIQAWEEGKAGGLTTKGAQRIVNALREEGVYCTVEWLIHGQGHAPYLAERVFIGAAESAMPNYQATAESEIVSRELLTFRQLNHDVADLVVSDDGMYPFYQVGDVIAGVRFYDQGIVNAIGKDCILETKNGQTLFRRLRHSKSTGRYNLQAIYLDTSIEEPVMYEIELFSAAPVIWHRRAR